MILIHNIVNFLFSKLFTEEVIELEKQQADFDYWMRNNRPIQTKHFSDFARTPMRTKIDKVMLLM